MTTKQGLRTLPCWKTNRVYVKSNEIFDQVIKRGIIAVLTIDNAGHAAPLSRALLEGGVSAIELTLRTSAALEAIQVVKKETPEMLLGAGTVLTPEQVDQVIDAGADFAVAPGTNPTVIQHAAQKGIPFGPGIQTATDIEIAIQHGCRILKYFPAETAGGLPHLRNMATPYKHLGIRFIPLGGIDTKNMTDYLSDPIIAAIGGSWIAKPDKIAAQDWAAITGNAKAAMEIAGNIDRG